jgi:omega-hydroxy-beta-dihydromenaquinone-9 sulfotransferase
MMPPSPPRVIIDHRPRDFWSVKNHPLSGITSAQWARMVWRHGGSMDVFTYWPRLLFITCMSVLNSFFALCDWLVYGRAVANQQLNDEPVFVLGHPRTGTTHLHNLLSKDERFAFATTFSVGFPSSFLCLRAVAPAIGLLMDSTRPMDNMSLAWDTPQEDELAMNQMSSGTSPYAPLLFPRKEKSFRPFYRFLLARTGSGEDSDLELEDADAEPCDPKDFERWRRAFILFLKKTQYAAGGARKRLLLKSPVHTARVRLIKSLFPKATFVFIHRHPLEVFRSAAHMADAYYWQCYLQRPRALDVQEFILHQGALLHRAYREDVAAMEAEKGRDLKTQKRLAEVRFAELDADPVGTLRATYAALGWTEAFKKVEPAIERYRRSLVDFKKNAFPEEGLSSEAEAEVRRRWRAWFEDLGYD